MKDLIIALNSLKKTNTKSSKVGLSAVSDLEANLTELISMNFDLVEKYKNLQPEMETILQEFLQLESFYNRLESEVISLMQQIKGLGVDAPEELLRTIDDIEMFRGEVDSNVGSLSKAIQNIS